MQNARLTFQCATYWATETDYIWHVSWYCLRVIICINFGIPALFTLQIINSLILLRIKVIMMKSFQNDNSTILSSSLNAAVQYYIKCLLFSICVENVSLKLLITPKYFDSLRVAFLIWVLYFKSNEKVRSGYAIDLYFLGKIINLGLSMFNDKLLHASHVFISCTSLFEVYYVKSYLGYNIMSYRLHI